VKLAIADVGHTLSLTNPDSGSAVEELVADYESAPLDIGCSARYLLDIMAHLDGDAAVIRFADARAGHRAPQRSMS